MRPMVLLLSWGVSGSLSVVSCWVHAARADVRTKASWAAGYWRSGPWVVSRGVVWREPSRLQANESAWAVD